jgi:aminotransferase
MQTCTFCVMDETDRNIRFDKHGRCNHCKKAASYYPPRTYTQVEIDAFILKVKKYRNANSKYDCVIGLSGGVDSSYLLYRLVQWGLKPLVVHVDAGWNSIESVENIQILVNSFNLDLETVIINWRDMRNLQLAFLKSGVKNQDVPQDHAFFTNVYDIALKHRIKSVILGSNTASESILPKDWGQNASDGKNIRGIYHFFNSDRMISYKTRSIYWSIVNLEVLKRIVVFCPLNIVDYDKEAAKSLLMKEFGYRDYGGKHSESTFTSYYQKIYLPKRFGIDKRKAHLSSMIVSKKMNRADAINELEKELCSNLQERDLRRFVATKLGLTVDELKSFERMKAVKYEKFGFSRSGIFLLRVIQKTKILVGRR